MNSNLVSAVVWLAAFSIISHGADLQCRFCFKYYLESCDGTYRREIGYMALSEQELKFTKHCSNEPWEKGHEIFRGSSLTSPEIPGNNFPMVSGRVPGQQPDDCGEDSVDVEYNNPQQLYPGEHPRERPIHLEDGSAELGVHQAYNSQYPDGSKPDQDPGYSGEGSVGTGANNVIIALHQSQYPEDSKPAQNPNYEAETVELGMQNLINNQGGYSIYQPQYPEEIKFGKHPGREKLAVPGLHNVIHNEGENTVYQSQYLNDLKPGQYPNYGGKGSVGTDIFNEINKVGENRNYIPQYSEGMKPNQHSSIGGEESINTGMYNVINFKDENTAFQPQYSNGLKPEDHPGYGGIRTVGIELPNIKNVKNENTIYQPQYLESFKPDTHPSYGREGTVEFQLNNVMNAKGGNTIYQPQYLNVFKPQQYPSYVGEVSVGNGINNEINKKVENTYYQPKYPDGYKLGRHSGYDEEGEGIVGSGMHSVIIPNGENTVYQPQYPKYFQPGQQPSNAREGAMHIETDHALDVESNYKIYKQQPEEFNPNEQDLQLDSYPSYVSEGIVGMGSQHATNAEGKNTVYQPPYQESFLPDEFSSFTGAGPVVNGMHFDINSNEKNTVFQPQIPENFQPEQFSSYDREGSMGIGMHYVKNVEGENTIYQPQYPGGIKPDQYLSYDGEELVKTGMNNLRKPKYKNQPHYPAINVDGENTVYQPTFPEGTKLGQQPSNDGIGPVGLKVYNLKKPKDEKTVNGIQFSEDFHPGQNFAPGGEGSVESGMHNLINLQGEQTVIQAQHLEELQPGQHTGNVGSGMHVLIDSKGKNTLPGPQHPEIIVPDSSLGGKVLVGFGAQHAINVERENNGYRPQSPDVFKPDQYSNNIRDGTVGIGMDNVINSEGVNSIYQPQYSDGSQPDQLIRFDGAGSLISGMNNINNTTDVNTVYKPQYPDGFEPGQLPSYGVVGSVGAGSHQVVNTDIENTVQGLQNPKIVKPGQHSSYDGEGTVETESNQVINTVQQPLVSIVINPDQSSSYNGESAVEIRTEDVTNIKDNNAGFGGPGSDVENTVQQPGYLSFARPGQLPTFNGEGSADLNSHHVVNYKGEKTVSLSQNQEGIKSGQIPSFDEEVSVETGMHHPQSPEDLQIGEHPTYDGERTVENLVQNNLRVVHIGAQSEYPDHLNEYQSGDVPIKISGTHTGKNLAFPDGTKPMQQPNYFQTGQYPSNDEKGSLGIGMHHAINIEGEHSIYESLYPEHVTQGQQPNSGVAGLVEAEINNSGTEMNNLRKPKYKNTGNVHQYPQNFQSGQLPSFGGEGSFGIHNEINTESKHTIYQPVNPEDAKPSQQPSTERMGSVEIEINILENPKDEKTVIKPHFSEDFQPGQNPAQGGYGSVDSGMHNVLNLKGEQTIIQAQHPENFQPGQHPGSGEEVFVGSEKHVLIDSKGKNTLHDSQYPDIILPDSSFGGKVSVGGGTQHTINVEGENTVYLPQSLDDSKPDEYHKNGGERTVGIGIDNVPQYSDGSKPDQFISFGGEGTVITGMNNVKNTTDVNTVYKPQYPDDSEPHQLPNFGVVGSVGAGSHQIVITDVENTVQGLQNPHIGQPGQHPNYDGEGTVETGSHQVINAYGENTVQQPVYPLIIQPGQRPSYDGDTVGIRTENVINLEGNNAGYGDVKNNVQQPDHPSVALPDQIPVPSREGSVDFNRQPVTNSKGEITVFLSQNQEGFKSGHIPSFSEEGSVESGMYHPYYPEDLQLGERPTSNGEGTVENLVQHNLKVVHSGTQSEYPDHFNEYQSGDVPIKISGIHTGKNLEYPDGTNLMQQENLREQGSGHQSNYPNENQSGPLVVEVSGGEELPQLSVSESGRIGSHEFKIEHKQVVNHVSYPEVTSDNNIQFGGYIPGSVNIESLQEPGYPYLGMKETSGLYQKGLLEPQALSGLHHTEVKQLGPVRYLSSDMLQEQSSEGMFGPSMAQNYLYKNPRQGVPKRGVLQYLQIPSRQKVVQHIVHHHVNMPPMTAGLTGMSAIIEKEKLAECLKKYGKACKKILENKFRIPENNWYGHYNEYVKPSQQNPMKDSYVDESAEKKLLYSQLYGPYDKQSSPFMEHIPKLEQSSSVKSSEQFNDNSINSVQLQALLANKKEEGKYQYAPAYMGPYMPQINQENYQNIPPAVLFGNIPDHNSYFKSEKSAKQFKMKSPNVITPGGSSEGTGSAGKIYHKIVKKIRVRTSKIRRMQRRNNDEGIENDEDENTANDPNELVEYVEEEVPENNDEMKN